MAKKINNNGNNLSFDKEIKAIRNKLKIMIDDMSDAQVLALLSFIVTPPDDFDMEDFDDEYDEEDNDYDSDDVLPF